MTKEELLSIDESKVWHPFTALKAPENILIKSAKGVWLETEDGRKIIDAVSSWWVNIHGHANEELSELLSNQVRELDHIIFAGFTHKPALEISNNLLAQLDDSFRRLFFSDDGSTSVEVALKLAIQYWDNQGITKKKVIAMEGAYHGDTFGAMSMAERGLFNKPFESRMFDVDFVPFPEGDGQNTLDKLNELLDTGDVACLIVEPLIQGTAGMKMYSPEILDKMFSLARSKDAILIADEVMTGFGRSGKLFATDYIKTKPDLMCMSKGITGGILPLGVTVINDKIESEFLDVNSKAFYHGHSYTANAMTCALAVKSLEILLRDSTQARIKAIESSHKSFVETNKDLLPATLRSFGTILAIEFNTELLNISDGYFSNIRDVLYNAFLERNILLRPLGNIVYVMPPYVISDEELQKIYDVILEVSDSLERN